MRKLFIILLVLMFFGCAGHPLVVVTDGSYSGSNGIVFSGSMDNPPDYYTYCGDGYGFAQIWPIGGVGGF